MGSGYFEEDLAVGGGAHLEVNVVVR